MQLQRRHLPVINNTHMLCTLLLAWLPTKSTWTTYWEIRLKHTHYKGGAVAQRVEHWTCGQQTCRRFKSYSGQSCITTLGKLFIAIVFDPGATTSAWRRKLTIVTLSQDSCSLTFIEHLLSWRIVIPVWFLHFFKLVFLHSLYSVTFCSTEK